jgi:hypothetical protein
VAKLEEMIAGFSIDERNEKAYKCARRVSDVHCLFEPIGNTMQWLCEGPGVSWIENLSYAIVSMGGGDVL